MTMQHQIHPDDERLAALAANDPEVESDHALRSHVSDCDRCRSLVDEVTLLRSALSELPDMVPSRRIQLLPPVAEPRAASGAGWLRRLAAPVMAAGFGLFLVGVVGTSGVLNGMALPGSAASASNVEDATDRSLNAAGQGGEPSSREASPTLDSSELGGSPIPAHQSEGGPHASPSSDDRAIVSVPTAPPGDDSESLSLFGQAQAPWLAVLVAGTVLLLTGIFLQLGTRTGRHPV